MTDPLRILLIDDDEHCFILNRKLLRQIGGRSVELDWEADAVAGLQALIDQRHEVYLLACRPGPDDGIELLRRARSGGCRAPVIILTGQADDDVDERALAAGATDCLAKDAADISGLQHAIRYALERQRLINALEHERNLLQSLMTSLPDNVYFKDRDSRFLRISDAMARWFGLMSPDDAVGLTDREFFTSDHAQQARADELQLLRTGIPILGKEERETWPDGHTTWVSTDKFPLRDESGNVTGTFGVSRDITTQKNALLALRRSERFSRRIVDTAMDAFVAFDRDGTIIDWNPQAEITFGWAREKALGQHVLELLLPEGHRESFRSTFNTYFATGSSPLLNQRLELSALYQGVTEFPVEMTIAIVDDTSTDAAVFGAFVHDISNRKKAERELRESRDAAEAANRAKSDFLANMSHEIRTPMNAIIGMSELVLDTDLSASQREYLTMVRDSSDSLLAIINDILDFSKIEAGKLELEQVAFSPRAVLGDTLKSLAVRAHRRSLELACHIDPRVPEGVMGDPSRLRQVVVNLVGNSIKFTQQGEVVVHVEVEEQNQQSVTLHFAVTDTGIGIPRDKLSDIFGAFEQADMSTTRRYGGTGLGLSICSRLVALMGGRIWVESEQGNGSTFHFTAVFRLSTGKPRSVLPRIVQGSRILVVDDNATNRLILEEMLTNWGVDVASVDGVDAALAALRDASESGRPFALVLSDVNMPDRDGFTLAEAIQADQKLADAVILMLTSGERPGDMQRCRDVGAAAYLLKPVKQSELFDSLVRALKVDGVGESTAHQLPGRDSLSIRLKPLRILLVEDSVVNQKLAIALLQKWGHAVVVAGDGLEALARLEVTGQIGRSGDRATQAGPDESSGPSTNAFDLVLMDVQMPVMDGLRATREIRQREAHGTGHVRVIAMTAHAMQGDREKCLAAGMDGYVSKPVRPAQLIEMFAAICPESVLDEPLPASQSGGDEARRTVAEPGAGDRTESSDVEDSRLRPEPYRVDWPVALKVVYGDHKLLRDVAGAFIHESRMVLSDLAEALQSGDAPTARRMAHTLKSGFRTFGVNDAHDLAQACEQSGRDGQLDDIRERLGDLSSAAASVTRQLKLFMDTDRIPGTV